MKIIVTHTSPDLDAISSVWLLKRFLPGWEEAKVEYVPAGQRLGNQDAKLREGDPIETIDGNEIIHVDTGLGPLDHHQTSDDAVCGASRTWDYVRQTSSEFNPPSSDSDKVQKRIEAISRIVKIVVDVDHFKDVFWKDSTADYHEFSLSGVLEGLKLRKPDQDNLYTDFIMDCLDSVLHNFENRIWAEEEIEKNGKDFETKWGKGIAFETINDTVIKLAQKMGYVIVVRKDPRKGYVRIKARPSEEGKKKVDLTLVYEKLKKMDPQATWFLHVSKKMLLNGTPKNPKMIPSRLKVDDIITVLKTI